MFRHEVRRIRLHSALTTNDKERILEPKTIFWWKLFRNCSQAESKERTKIHTTFEFLIQNASFLRSDFSIEVTDLGSFICGTS